MKDRKLLKGLNKYPRPPKVIDEKKFQEMINKQQDKEIKESRDKPPGYIVSE